MTLGFFSTAARDAMVDALVDLCDAGTGSTTGDVALYNSSNQLLATFDHTGSNPVQNPMFGASSSGVATLQMTGGKILCPSVTTTGTVNHIRFIDRDGGLVFLGTAGTNPPGGFDLIMNTTQVTSGNPVEITSFTVTAPT